MRSIQTVAHLDTEASGVAYVVPRLARSLAGAGCRTEVFALAGERTIDFSGAAVSTFAADRLPLRGLRKLGRSTAMRDALLRAPAEVYHAHGLWMMPNVYPADAARAAGRPFILSPHGMLGAEALQFSRLPKRVFWLLWQKRALAGAACLHATSQAEYEDIRRFGLKQPVAIIPNGIDLPDLRPVAQGIPARRPYVLSLGRLHPKKALDRLVSAFAQVAGTSRDWQLRIVGPDDGRTGARLLEQVNALGLVDRVSIEGPVFGEAKLALMREAEVFALSSLNENFCMTVAESLAAGTPVISTRGAPWPDVVTHRCGWWIDHGPDAMAAALAEAMAMAPDERLAMGARGREWMERDFDWRSIGKRMCDVYEWALGRQVRPDFVIGGPGPGSGSQ
ncbi:glycosyltransferase [Aestuariivirga litoralis]|nr:glycosyltransferase [Aestuariivirga litoralis]